MATATFLMSPATRGRSLTMDEYLDADYVEGYRYELAQGVLEVTKIPKGRPHGRIVWFFTLRLADYHRDHPEIIDFFGGAGEYHLVLPTMVSGRNPDVAVTLVGTPKDADGERPPSLAIEVVSPGKRARERDYITKRQEYLAYGLREYWIVDPVARRVTVLVRNGDAWTERVFHDGQTASGLVLPGFAVPVAEIWPTPEDENDRA
ncbi:MAG: Uma2 family endonuclease [Isosphaeraceae bacterium]